MQNPILSVQTVLEAQKRISPFVCQTPIIQPLPAENVHYKMECWQKTGSFKARGALNALLAMPTPGSRPFVAASAGNHGLGVAYAAQVCGARAIIFVPETVAPAKLQALREMGVRVEIRGKDYDDAEAEAIAHCRKKNLPFVHAFADPRVIAGQGTIGLEIVNQTPPADRVVIPIGGGGLISGVALVLKSFWPQVEIVGVQPETCPAMLAAVQAGAVVETPMQPTLADGLAGRFVHETTLALTRQFVDRLVLVSETAIRDAMHELFVQHNFVVEASAAVGLAALREGHIPDSGKCLILLTGSNSD